MKKAITIIVSVLFVFALTSVSFAVEKAAAPAAEKKAEPAKMEEKKAPAKVKQVTGNVTAVDAKAKTITVRGRKGDVVIAIDDKALADVKTGDTVVVKYTEADGKNTAKSVKKSAAKPAEKKVEPATNPAEKK